MRNWMGGMRGLRGIPRYLLMSKGPPLTNTYSPSRINPQKSPIYAQKSLICTHILCSALSRVRGGGGGRRRRREESASKREGVANIQWRKKEAERERERKREREGMVTFMFHLTDPPLLAHTLQTYRARTEGPGEVISHGGVLEGGGGGVADDADADLY